MSDILASYHKHPVIIGNIRIPLFFRFTQNPNNWKLQYKKEYKKTQTIGGYVFEHWGNQPATLEFDVHIKKDSNLGQLVGASTTIPNFGLEDPTFSWELIALQTLFNLDQRKYDLASSRGSVLSDEFKDNVSSLVNSLKSKATSKISTLTKASAVVDNTVSPSPTTLAGYANTFTDTIIYYKGCIYCGFFTDMRIEEEAKEPYWHTVHMAFTITTTTLDWIDNMLVDTANGKAILSLWGVFSSTVTVGSLLKDVIGSWASDITSAVGNTGNTAKNLFNSVVDTIKPNI